MLYSTRGTYEAGRRLGRELTDGDIRAEALMSVPCPKCDAPRGSWCVYATTCRGTFQSIHAGRQRAVERHLGRVTQEAAAYRCVVGEPCEDYFICATHDYTWEVDKQPYCNAENAPFIWAAAFYSHRAVGGAS